MGHELTVIGQSFRPVLVALPLGLLVITLLFDVAHVAGVGGGLPVLGEFGYWNLAAGAAASALAAMFGVADLLVLPVRSATRRTAATHRLVHIWSVGLLTLVWLARTGAEGHFVGGGLFLVELLGFAGVAVATCRDAPLAWRAAIVSGPRPVDQAELSDLLRREVGSDRRPAD